MTDKRPEESKCTNASTKTTATTKAIATTAKCATDITQTPTAQLKETEKMLKQTIATNHDRQTAQINENGNERNGRNDRNEKRTPVDNNNISVGSADSGVGDVIESFKGDLPDALGFKDDDSSTNKTKYVARMPIERHAVYYNMNHKNRGRALIFNHEKFDIPNLEQRHGTDKDCENLRQTLAQLDFDVETHNDCKLIEILQVIDKVSSEDHTDNDCIVITILSHGEHGYIYAKDAQYKIDTIAHHFSGSACPSLAGKPKLFFIQACRGDRFDSGIVLERAKTETDGESSANYKIPVHADFLFAYSTIPGFYSWRSPTHGSWFIQALVRELSTNGKKNDILTLLTFVNQRVAFDYESYVPNRYIMHNQKQIPCITSMLTRILRFSEKTSKAG